MVLVFFLPIARNPKIYHPKYFYPTSEFFPKVLLFIVLFYIYNQYSFSTQIMILIILFSVYNQKSFFNRLIILLILFIYILASY